MTSRVSPSRIDTEPATGTGELVVLLDSAAEPLGTAPKATVHDAHTPLHLAFSCHLLDESGRVLVTRRALGKVAWPGVWTNAFCGHPAPGESMDSALRRRAAHELGAEISEISEALPDFRYRAVDDSGIVENEVCPVFTARLAGGLDPNPDEVSAHHWVEPRQLARAVSATPFVFSPWCVRHVEAMGLYTG